MITLVGTGNQTLLIASERKVISVGLFKRSGGKVWWMRFNYKGKQIRRSTGSEDKKLANRIYDKVKGQVAENRWFEQLPGKDKKFKEMMDKYLKEYSAKNKAVKTYIRDRSLSNHLLHYFGNLTLSTITPRLITGYKTERLNSGAAPKTINNELTLMGHAFNLAIREWEWCKENPVSRVSKFRVNNQIERWLTFEEEQKLLSVSPSWLQEMIIFAINTGLRQSELLNLQWSQVDLFRRTLTILEQKNRGKDTLPLNQSAMEVLKERARVRQNGWVFYNKSSKIRDARCLLRAFYAASKKASIHNLRWHDLRHSFATRLIQGGADIYTVQKLGRWKNISMVTRYAHHYPESLRPGIEILDRMKEKSTKIAPYQEKRGYDRIATP